MGRGFGGAGGAAGERVRAQTAIVGLVLLIGVVAVASLGIFLTAGEGLSDVERQAETERVESAFLEVGQELRTATAARDVDRTVTLDVDRVGGSVERTDAGTIRVEVEDGETIERSLGTLEYRGSDGTRVVYQAGGVWTVADGEVRTVAEPTVYFGEGTLTFPVPVFADDEDAHPGARDVSLSVAGSDRLYSDLNEDYVTITIESEFYEWWGDRFAEMGSDADDVTVRTNPEAGSANATFEEVDGGIELGANIFPERAVETQGELDTSDGGGSETIGTVVSGGDANVRQNVDGDVIAKGDVEFGQMGEVTGTVAAEGNVTGMHQGVRDVIAGGDVEMGGSNGVAENVYAYGDVTFLAGSISGEVIANGTVDDTRANCNGCTIEEHVPVEEIGPHPSDYTDDVEPHDPLDDVYEAVIASIDADEIDAEELDSLEAGDTLEAGTYVVDEATVQNGALVFDVADGDVDVFMRGDLHMDSDGKIRTLNAETGNAARVFTNDTVDAAGTWTGDICAAPSVGTACRDIPDEDRNSHGLQFYGTADAEFVFRDQLVFHGIVYAPQEAGSIEDNAIVASGHLNFFGTFVVGGIDGRGEVSFEHDRDLEYDDPVIDGDGSAGTAFEELTYVHVTAHEVAVAGD